MAGLEQLLRRMNDFDYVSFDVFDTAVVRLVAEPADLYAFVAGEYRRRTGLAGNGVDFEAARRRAERRARARLWAERAATDVTLDEIYADLEAPGWDHAALRAIEIEMERALCRPHEPVRAIYDEALRRNKKVLFISDMYLPADTISAILRDCGYSDLSRLYVSSALEGRTKSTGALYRHVLDDLRIPPGALLHVGDNQRSDVIEAARTGIAAHYVERVALRASFGKPLAPPSADSTLYRGLVAARHYARTDARPDDFWYRLGYDVAGILLMGFVQWLAAEMAKDGIEHVYFLARDGHILQKVYHRILAARGAGPQSTYLHASRRALNIPAISAVDDATIGFFMAGRTGLTVRQFVERVGLTVDETLGAIAEAGFASPDECVRNGAGYARLRNLFRSLGPALLAVADEERPYLLRYLEQSGLFIPRRVAVVDLGWHGTLQASIQTVLDGTGRSHADVRGYYLGTFTKAAALRARGVSMRGYLCTQGEPAHFQDLIRSCVEIFEFMHVAPHGSTVRFHEEGGAVVPLLAPDDSDDAKLAAASQLQEAALDFVDDWLAATARFPWLTITAETATAPIERLLRRPTREEAVALGDLTHADGYGGAFQRFPIARRPIASQLLRDPRSLYREYQDSFWREGYAVRLMGDSDAARRLRQSMGRVASSLASIKRELSRRVRSFIGRPLP